MSNLTSLLSFVVLLASTVILLAAALHDIATRTAPNWMAATLVILGLGLQIMHDRLAIGLLAAFIVFAMAAFCWRRGWMGGGDVKLLGAAAMVVPPSHVMPFVAAVALTGAVLALIYLGARRIIAAPSTRRPARFVARAIRAERWRISRGGPLPYALAIAAGFLITTL